MNQASQSSAKSFRHKRYAFYALLAFILLTSPFVRIGEAQNHIFLLSFDHGALHLFGASFGIQEFYVLPFLLIILFVGILFLTVVWGRIWCGWGCPQTIFRTIYRDLIQTKILGLRRKIANKQEILKLDTPTKKLKYALGLGIFFIVASAASANFLFFFVPPEDFFPYLMDPTNHTVLIGFWLVITIFMTLEVCFVAENFCTYMCPYARIQSVFFDNNTLLSIYDKARGGAVYGIDGQKLKFSPKKQNPSNECTNCTQCVKVCPTHIDIRKGLQLECIHCLECVDACSSVMGALGRPTLVQWASTNDIAGAKARFLRIKVLAYVVILALLFAGLFIAGTVRNNLSLNISRTAELYTVRQSGAVDNAYKFLIQNKDGQAHEIGLEIEGDLKDSIEILVPDYPGKTSFNLQAKSERMLVVLLRSKTSLNDSMDSDKNLPVTIRARVLDSKDGASARFKTFFMYPSQGYRDAKLKRKNG